MNQERKAALSVYMTTEQVCKYINKSENWVLQHKHELGSSKRTGTLVFKRAAIDEFIAQDWYRIGENVEVIVR